MLQTSERIRALRELRGWTQAEFASFTGLSQNVVSTLETGQRTVTTEHIRRIAELTGTPYSFFTLSTADLSDRELHFRAKKTARVTATRTIMRKFSESHAVARRLSRSYQPKRSITPVEGPLDGNAIEALSIDLRKELGLDESGPIAHITRSCERAGIAVTALAPVPGADSHHAGLSYTAPDGFASIAYVAGQPGDRHRMTIGHELAHRVLHARRIVEADRREKEAFRLAGALFIPKKSALQEISPSMTLTGFMRLKATWGISIAALVMRAHDLSIIDGERKTSLMRQISRKGWRMSEPVEVEIEQPALLAHLLFERFGASPYRTAEPELGYARSDLLEWIPPVSEQNGAGLATITDIANRRL
jgi:Zn-dependent peptidase ImmA (M78 family)/transcriptional regulator with XRE-family HTH domain